MHEIARKILDNPIQEYPAATVACFDPTRGSLPRRDLDEARLVDYLQRLSKAGADAVLMGASTGQGHLRTVDELARWFEVAGQADLGDTVKMALLRPEDGKKENARLIEILKDNDYPVVFVRPGTDLPRFSITEQILENMRPVIGMLAEAELAIGVYSIPDVSGVPLPAVAAERLLDIPGGENIVAAKITEADYIHSTREYLLSPRLAKLKIVQGWDPHLTQALREGPRSNFENRQRVGVTSGPMSFAVFQYVHLLKAAADHDWEEVAACQDAVSALFASMQDDPEKFADLQRAKYLMGLGHPITAEVSEYQVQQVLETLEALPRDADRQRLAKSLDLMEEGPFHEALANLAAVTPEKLA